MASAWKENEEEAQAELESIKAESETIENVSRETLPEESEVAKDERKEETD